MYAVIESCGKQYKVAEGDVVFFEKLDAEEGKVQVGNPYVKGVKVEGKVVSHGKGKKIIVFKMKAKKNYRRKQGHRQPYTKVEITAIKLPTAKKEVAEEKKAETTAKTTTKKAATKTSAAKAEKVEA